MAHTTPYDITLANGLRVVICPDNSAPVVNVTVMYRVGSHDERAGKTGLAHLFEHLMFDNAAPGVDKQYDVYCTKAGGTNNAYTTFDYTTYHIDVPSHNLELGLWLESERMRSFRITDYALQTQRSVVVEEINQNVFNQPYGIWRKAQQEISYTHDSSYSWDVYGSPEDVAGVTMDDARGFFDTYYHPSNAVLCVAGDVDLAVAKELVERHFGSITDSRAEIERTTFAHSMTKRGTTLSVEDNVPLTAVFASIHMPGFSANDLLDAEIASSIIGTGRSSVLYKKLVSDLRIASGVGCFLDRRAHDSLLTMYAYASEEVITADQLASAMSDALAQTTITETMLESAVNKMKTSHAAELQKVSGVADVVAWTTLFWNDPLYVNTALDRYASITLADVQGIVDRCASQEEIIRLDIVPAKA
jgi:predicted Zn-dependent peptidase